MLVHNLVHVQILETSREAVWIRHDVVVYESAGDHAVRQVRPGVAGFLPKPSFTFCGSIMYECTISYMNVYRGAEDAGGAISFSILGT